MSHIVCTKLQEQQRQKHSCSSDCEASSQSSRQQAGLSRACFPQRRKLKRGHESPSPARRPTGLPPAHASVAGPRLETVFGEEWSLQQ